MRTVFWLVLVLGACGPTIDEPDVPSWACELGQNLDDPYIRNVVSRGSVDAYTISDAIALYTEVYITPRQEEHPEWVDYSLRCERYCHPIPCPDSCQCRSTVRPPGY